MSLRKWALVVLAVVAVVAVGCKDQQEEKEGAAVKRRNPQKEFEEDRANTIARIGEKITRLEKSLDELQRAAAAKGSGARAAASRLRQSLTRGIAALREKLTEAEQATTRTWPAMKKELKNTIDDMEDKCAELMSQVME